MSSKQGEEQVAEESDCERVEPGTSETETVREKRRCLEKSSLTCVIRTKKYIFLLGRAQTTRLQKQLCQVVNHKVNQKHQSETDNTTQRTQTHLTYMVSNDALFEVVKFYRKALHTTKEITFVC